MEGNTLYNCRGKLQHFSETWLQQSYDTVIKQTYERRDLQICAVLVAVKMSRSTLYAQYILCVILKIYRLKQEISSEEKNKCKNFSLFNATRFKSFLLVCLHSYHIFNTHSLFQIHVIALQQEFFFVM